MRYILIALGALVLGAWPLIRASVSLYRWLHTNDS